MIIDPGHRKYQFKAETWPPEYYEYRRRWEDNPKKGVAEKYPLNIDIETTNRCNLACPFCVREFMDEGVGDFSDDNYSKIINEIQGGKVPAMKFNYRGEPTLFKNLPTYINRAKRAGVIETMINTNGTLMDERMSEELCKSGLDRIIFSIDSINPDIYRKQRIGAELDDVLDNLRGLLRVREELELERPYVKVQKVDLPESRGENYIGFFQEMGVDSAAINSLKEKDATLVDWPPLPCAQPFQRLLVTFRGDILPCCQGNLFKPLGNISSVTIKEAWHSPTMSYLRDMHKSNRQAEIPQCRKCEITRPGEEDGRKDRGNQAEDGAKG